jgi:hypothetical protein
MQGEPPRETPPAGARVRPQPRGLTARAVLIGLGCVILLCGTVPYNDFHLQNTFLYGNHFPLGAIFLYTLLILGVNVLLYRVAPRYRLGTHELLTIWAMMLIGAGLASSGLMRYLGPLPISVFYYGTANHWQPIMERVPAWLVPTTEPKDPIILHFFEGAPEGAPVPWRPWVRPLAAWSALFLAMYGMMVCLSSLFRRPWVEAERLSFPLVTLPIEMAREPERGKAIAPLFRSPVMWLGFGLVTAIHTMNGLHSFQPSLPEVNRSINFGAMFPERPWNGLGIAIVDVYFSVIGMVYLLPTEVSFSLWFFYVLFRLARVARVMAGVEAQGTGVPNWETALNIGAFIVWGAYILYVARFHLRDAFGKAFGFKRHVDDSREALSYRATVFGLIGSFAAILTWCHFAGISWLLGAAIFGFFALMLLIVSRVVAEGGLLFVQAGFVPTDGLTALFGAQWARESAWAAAALPQTIFMHDLREVVMPNLLNTFKLQDTGAVSARSLLLAGTLALGVGLIVSASAFLVNAYTYGGVNLDRWGNINAPRTYMRMFMRYIENPVWNDPGPAMNVGLGGLLTGFVIAMRNLFFWWPIHPIGLAISRSYAMTVMWLSILLSWGIKVIILRYGGLRMYRLALPFFLGLVLGEGFIGGVWAIIGLITGGGRVRFLPG